VNFVAGGISTPADAALAMQLGAEGVFVRSGIFKSEDPARRARAIVQATTHFNDPKILAEVSKGLGSPMRGIELSTIPEGERLRSAAGRSPSASAGDAARDAAKDGSGGIMKIGVLALQGAFFEHAQILRRIGVEAVEVRLPAHLDGLSALILPAVRAPRCVCCSTGGSCGDLSSTWPARGRRCWGRARG